VKDFDKEIRETRRELAQLSSLVQVLRDFVASDRAADLPNPLASKAVN
jgi:hypothetical protein